MSLSLSDREALRFSTLRSVLLRFSCESGCSLFSLILLSSLTMKTIYVEVAVRIADDADPFETIADCDYQFSGDGILSHEIVHVETDTVLFSL